MEGYVILTWQRWDEAEQRTMFADRWPETRQVIERRGEIAGFLDLEYRADQIYVGNIELRAEAQGGRLGTAILRDIQEQARLQSLSVALQVLRVNPARGLYARLGFEISGETETHYQMVWRPE